MVKKTGLGKGLGSLISETTIEANTEEMLRPDTELDVELIHRNINQPRTQFDEEELQELSDSIKQYGILQPILVRKDADGYQIVAGERRYQAALRAGLKQVPVIVRKVDDQDLLEIALIENIQRSNLNSIEEARAYREILQRTNATQEELSVRLSKSRSAIANTLRLLELPEEIQDLVFDGNLTAGHARALLGLSGDEEVQTKLAYRIIKNRMSVRQVEEAVKREQEKEQGEQPKRVSRPATYIEAEKAMSTTLKTKVKVQAATKKKTARIEISFENEEELNRILGALGIEL